MKKAKLIRSSILGILGLLGACFVWGVAIEPYLLDREEEVAVLPRLPDAWVGQQVGVIADLQVGMWSDNEPTIRRAVQQLIEADPAIVLVAGDLVYDANPHPREEIQQVVELLQPLVAAGIPTFAVLGNHDYVAKPDATKQPVASQLQQALVAAGITVLQNEAVPVQLPTRDRTSTQAQPLYVVGLGAHRLGLDRPDVALAEVPDQAPRLVLMHNPASFAELPSKTAPVAIAGHTHGGQVRIPFTPEWSWMTLVADKPRWDWIAQVKDGEAVQVAGWIEGYGQPGNHLYINRGIGFSRFPIRFNCPPEITLFTLQNLDSVS